MRGGDLETVDAEGLVAFAVDGFAGAVEVPGFGGETGEGVGVEDDFTGVGGGFEADGVGDGRAGVLGGRVGGVGGGNLAGGDADAEPALGGGLATLVVVLFGEEVDVVAEGVGVGGVVEEEDDAVTGAGDDGAGAAGRKLGEGAGHEGLDLAVELGDTGGAGVLLQDAGRWSCRRPCLRRRRSGGGSRSGERRSLPGLASCS